MNYEVELPGYWKRLTIFHVNLLRKWEQRTPGAFVAQPADEDDNNPLIAPDGQGKETWRDVTIDPSVNSVRHQHLKNLLQKYSNIFTNLPGGTDLVKDHFEMLSETPVRQRPYRLPEALKAAVKKELAQMLAQGVIRPSTSPWASPLVIVEKKDGSLRLCVDYHKLNSITVFDVYPIPRVDEVVEKIGNDKFISSIGLSKAYWQILLGEVCQKKSAFLAREKVYPAVDKECLAIVWATPKLQSYLHGRYFIVQTDHQPLTWLQQVKTKSQRLLWWSLILQQYRFELQHRRGHSNGNADGLSRAWA